MIFFSGLELKHWKEMVENPRRPIVHWHVLKVGDVDITLYVYCSYVSCINVSLRTISLCFLI